MSAEGPIVHFVVNRMPYRGGGLHQAVRDRANTLAEHGVGSEIWIDVLRFQTRLRSRVARERRAGRLHPKVQVRSVLSMLDESRPKRNQPTFVAPQGSDVQEVKLDRAGRRSQYLRDGVLEMSVVRDRRGLVEYVDYYDRDGSRRRREDVERSGRVERVTEYAPSGDPVVQRFVGRDGDYFLNVWMVPGTENWGRSTVLGEETKEFATPGELYRFAFERYLSLEEEPVLCSENRENRSNIPDENMDDIVRSVRHPRIRRVAIAHSSHLLAPYQAGSRLAPNWNRLLEGIDDWDCVAVWTPAQREELISRVGHADRIVAIPPVAPAPAPAQVPVDPNRLVLVARTHPKKRVDEAIRVFHAVRQGNPDARLEVFGFGYGDDEEAKIEALIDELDIRKDVHFKGFTKDRQKIYGGAVATILTSASEGLGLALLESMAYGVPVVAYDSNYGPRDVIVEGENGYLVPFGEYEAAAERVLQLMADPQTRRDLGEGARRSLGRFDLSSYLKRWRGVLEGRP